MTLNNVAFTKNQERREKEAEMNKPKKLYTAVEVGQMIGKSKDWVLKNQGVNGFPAAYYVTGVVYGWKENQIQGYLKEKGK